jgi:hypothetical protein
MRCLILAVFLVTSVSLWGQIPVDLKSFDKKSGVKTSVQENLLSIEWPAGEAGAGKVVLDLRKEKPLISSLQIGTKDNFKIIADNLEPAVILTVGKRDLISQNGWNIFFDKTAYLPYKSYAVKLDKTNVSVVSSGSQTEVIISGASAGPFAGSYNITVFNGSSLMNIAAVMSTTVDSLAVLYDAGLASSAGAVWKKIFWSDTEDYLRGNDVSGTEQSKTMAVKYRTIIGEGKEGSLAVFPAPHQFFYPLDNCYNLEYTWYGKDYRSLVPGFGIGLRHDLLGPIPGNGIISSVF